MRSITAKYINDNLSRMIYGERIEYRGATYWVAPNTNDDGTLDLHNGTIYSISADRNLAGCSNGYEYGKVVNGIAYK